MAFDPDEYLAQTATNEFDPDAYLSTSAPSEEGAGQADSFDPDAYLSATDDPSLGEIGAGLATEVAVGEGSKLAGAAAGTAILPGIGTAVGYVVGALAGGATGSIAAQKIEGREDLSYGRIVADSLINLIPGSKLAKGTKFGARATSAAIKQGGAGAAIAPAAQAVESYIEEGELPELEQLGAASIIGGALGSSLGISSEAATSLYRKFAKSTPQQIQSAVLKGDKDAVKLVDATTKDVEIGERSASGRLKELWEHALVKLAPSRIVGREIFDMSKQAKDTVTSGKAIGSILRDRVNKKIAASPDPELAEDAVSRYILGEANTLPKVIEDIQDDLDYARGQIRGWQDELIENHYNGTRPLPETLLDEIESSRSREDYLTQEYQFFENPNYKPSSKDRQAVIKEFEEVGKTKADAEKYLADLESRRNDPEMARSLVFKTRESILKKKRLGEKTDDLSLATRKYLGEITQPGERLEGTISRMASLVGYDSADFRIKELLQSQGLVRSAGQDIEGHVRLALRSGIAREGQEPLYVPRNLQRALDRIYGARIDQKSQDVAENLVRDALGSGIAVSKAVKVLANPPSYGVQVFGNLANLIGMGMNPFAGSKLGAKHGASQFARYARTLSPDDLDVYRRAIELDLVQPNVTVSDIRAGLNEGKIGGLVSKALNPLGKAYSVPDVMFRVAAFENYKSMLMKQFPGLSAEAAKKGTKAQRQLYRRMEEEAASLTNATYQNYSFLNESLRTLSKYGVLGQFAAFSLELMRNQYNQAKLIRKMLNGEYASRLSAEFGEASQSEITKEALKRMAALSAVYGSATAGVTMFNRMVGGVTEEEERAYRESVLADYEKNRELVLFKKDGKLYHKNASYMIPHAQMAGVVTSALRGESFQDAAAKAFGTLREDVGGELPFVIQSLVPAVGNYMPAKDEPISTATNAGERMVDQAAWFAGDAFTPGISREIDRVLEGQPISQTVLRQLGIRINDTTIEEGAGYKIRNLEGNLAAQKTKYNRDVYDGADPQQAYEKHNQDYRDNFRQIIQHTQNYRQLGLGEDELIKLLKDNRLSGRQALKAVDGVVDDLNISVRDTPTSRWEAMQNLPDKEQLSAIRNVEDRSMRDSLMRKYRRAKEYERKGISERDKVIMSLGVSDGTRSKYILDRMESGGGENYLREMMRKGIATERVVQQIRQRQRM